MALTDDAKREIADAIRIVREDKFEQYARTTLGKHAPKVEDPSPRPEDPKPDDPPAPPPKSDDPPAPPTNKPKSRYWGDIFDDES